MIPWHKEKRTVDPALVSIDPPYTISQRFAIADCLFNHQGESEWFGVFDVDEFLVLHEHESIHQFVSFLPLALLTAYFRRSVRELVAFRVV